MASPIGNYIYAGQACSVVAAGGSAPCNMSAVNERGEKSSFCYDGTPNVTLPGWGITGVIDSYGNIVFSNGATWQAVIPTPAAITSPAAVAAAAATPTDFFSGTTLGISNLALVGIAVVGVLFMSSGGGRR